MLHAYLVHSLSYLIFNKFIRKAVSWCGIFHCDNMLAFRKFQILKQFGCHDWIIDAQPVLPLSELIYDAVSIIFPLVKKSMR